MDIKRSYIVTILILVILIVGGLVVLVNPKGETTPPVTPAITELPQDQNGNFVLYVSNQSSAINPVDIKIYIDAKLAVKKDFYVGTQHSYTSFRFSLSEDKHSIKIESKNGDAILKKVFKITDKHRGIVEYWYYPETHYDPTPRHFTFTFGKDEPLLID